MGLQRRALAVVLAIAFILSLTAQAQVPPDVARQLREIGTGVCVPETAKLYKPLQPKPPSSEVTIVRDIPYAQDPRTIMDVFAPTKGGGGRPVLVYVSGGAGDKKVNGPDGDPFYDNIMYWALKNGMTGVNMQRRERTCEYLCSALRNCRAEWRGGERHHFNVRAEFQYSP
jgi:hypothetical protein